MADGELKLDELPDPGGRYELGSRIASGMLTEVFQAVDTEAGRKTVAVKVVRLEKDSAERCREELRVLKDLSRHANLPDFHGAYLRKGRRAEPDQLWFVMELCEGGPVTDLVRRLQTKNRRLTEEQIAYVLKETVKALVDFHEAHVMHRDVKGGNVLLTKEGEVKLVGFQLARKLRSALDKRQTCIGSPCWMAPEVVTSNRKEIEDAGYDNRADVWSLGITAIELGDGKAPFQDMHPTRALFQIVRNPPPTLSRPANWSQLYNDFISECLEKNPEHRPFVVELMEHPFITSVPENDYHLAQELKALLQDAGPPSDPEDPRPESFVRGQLLQTGPGAPLEPMRVEDLAALDDPREDRVLVELQERLRRGRFHTFVGDVLLVLNPNEQHDVYGPRFHAKYQCKSRSDNEPHVYAVADRAYQDALHHEEPQRILLAGESLSGKTFNFRHLLRHLCHLGKGGGDIGERVDRALDVVHALGNAATPLNPDSTRHLLQLEVTFTSTGKTSGAIFWLFQLEKWRVTCSDRSQANFHVFYYLYDALEADGDLGRYRLAPGRRQRYLRAAGADGGAECAAGPRELERGENARRFRRLEAGLATLGLDEEQRNILWRLVAAVLSLGEVQFRDSGDGAAEVADLDAAANAAWLLGVDEKKFAWALTNYCVVEKGTAVRRRHSPPQAEEARDALAAGVYCRLVDWVVNVVNLKLSFTRAVFGDKYSVSLMDLFGFECFKKNSLEQLFVNTINEQLQYHYTQRMFVWEMQEQEEEEIPLQTLQFYDNKPTVDELMSKPNGLLYLLDEASRSSRGSELIIETLKGEQRQSTRLQAIGRHDFTVAHYTGKVTYCAQQMAGKNRDFLPPEMIETLRLSSDHVVQKLFTNQLSRTGNLTLTSEERGAIAGQNKGRWGAALLADSQAKPRKFNTESHGEYSQTRKMRTAAATFRGTCLELLRGLAVGAGSGGTHFVRCLRVDLSGQPRGFQPEVVRQQIRALAVIETARARQKGYPHRVPFPEFIRRYKFLAFDFDENVDVTKDNCRLLLIRLKMEGWVIGKSKVFLKYYNEEFLSRTYESQVKKIIKVQTMMRAFLAKKNVASKMLKSRQNTVDSVGKQSSRKSSVKYTEETAAVMIQKQFRGFRARKEYGTLLERNSGHHSQLLACRRVPSLGRSFSSSHPYIAVHLYNQKAVTGLQSSDREAVSLEQVDPGARASLVMPRRRPSVWKLPFRLDDVPFFDTAYMCDPLSAQGNKTSGVGNDQESWDAPLRRTHSKPLRDHHLQVRDKEVQTGLSPCNENDYLSTVDNFIEAPFNRDPKQMVPGKQTFANEYQRKSYAKNMNKMPIHQAGNNRFDHRDFNSSRVITKEKQSNVDSKPYVGSFYPRSDLPRPYQRSTPRIVASQVDNSYHRDLENNVTDNWSSQSSASPSVKAPNEYDRHNVSPTKRVTGAGKIKNPIEELKMKGRQMSNDYETDDPPFNFQAMLRKTNTTRASLRRGGADVAGRPVVYGSPSPPPSSWPGAEGQRILEELESVVNEAEEAEEDEDRLLTTTTELAPGIVVQGLVAEL